MAVPGLIQLRGYQRCWLGGDVLAGITVAAYLVPQVMAYAELAGLPPVAGLWAIMPPLAIYAVLGSSRQLSVGPESTTALMAATVVAPLAAGNLGRYAELAAALAVVVGLLSVVAWALRLGFVADLLSQPILVGYLAGVAVIMMVGQLGKISGVPVKGDTLGAELASFVRGLDQLQAGTLLLGLATLVFLFAVQWQFPQVPGPLLAVLLATAAVAVFDLEAHGIAVIGEVPAGLPRPSLPPLGDFSKLLLPAVGVLLVGYTDNVLTARAFAAGGGYAVDANQDLLALGAANVGAGVFQGFPISSSGSRTAIGAASGSRTQLYSLIALASVSRARWLVAACHRTVRLHDHGDLAAGPGAGHRAQNRAGRAARRLRHPRPADATAAGAGDGGVPAFDGDGAARDAHERRAQPRPARAGGDRFGEVRERSAHGRGRPVEPRRAGLHRRRHRAPHRPLRLPGPDRHSGGTAPGACSGPAAPSRRRRRFLLPVADHHPLHGCARYEAMAQAPVHRARP